MLPLTVILALAAAQGTAAAKAPLLRCAMVRSDEASIPDLQRLRDGGYSAVAIAPTDSGAAAAAGRVRELGLKLYYWVEIGRSPGMAEAHPRWMASIQGHGEWMRRFPQFEPPEENEVVKVYPWVPIGYREAFDEHLNRVDNLLRELPKPTGVFLNDLQGAPSACGCGNLFCRWTTDYGPISTAAPMPKDAAARFVQAVKVRLPGVEVIPVWLTECEQHEKQSACGGVGCFDGICWMAWTEQLMPLARASDHLSVLATYKALGRDQAVYGEKAAWVKQALNLFAEMPSKRAGRAVPASRLYAVLQGWDVTDKELAAQKTQAEAAGAAGWVVALTPIDQSWQPRKLAIR